MKSSLEARIRKHEADLRSRYPRVTACRVSVEDRPPRLYDEDPGSALRAAFEAANQQLEALKGPRRS